MPLMVQPDLPVQILMPEHKPTKPGLTAGTQSSGPLLAAPTHTAVPRENPGWLTSALLEGFGFFTRPAGKQGSAVLRLSWQGHQTCTPQGSAVIGLRALTKSKCLTALLQEGPWASWGGDYSAWDLDFYFFFPLPPNPQSNLPQRGTVSERHPNPSTYLRWLFLTTSLYYLPVLRAVSQPKKKQNWIKLQCGKLGPINMVCLCQ